MQQLVSGMYVAGALPPPGDFTHPGQNHSDRPAIGWVLVVMIAQPWCWCFAAVVAGQ